MFLIKEEGQIRNFQEQEQESTKSKNSMILPKISTIGIDVTKQSEISYSAKYYSDTR